MITLSHKKLILLFTAVLVGGAAIPWVKSHWILLNPPAGEPITVPALEAVTPVQPLQPASQPAYEDSLMDHEAIAAIIQGDVKILKKGMSMWTELQAGTVVQAGDQVKTGEDSLVGLSFDSLYLNMAQINENSLAEFLSIEPTRIHIIRGEIYTILEGLPEGSAYDVITPTSVGGVRGTHFIRSFDSQHQLDTTSVLKGKVEVTIPAAGVAAERVIPIAAHQKLTFSADQLGREDRHQIKVESLPYSLTNTFESLFRQMRDRLLAEVGGEETAAFLQQQWEQIKNDPAKIMRIKKKVQVAVLYGRETAAKESPAPAEKAVLVPLSDRDVLPPAASPDEDEFMTFQIPDVDPSAQEETLAVSVNICESNPHLC